MNRWRSPTAEKIYRNHPLVNVRSAGTSPKAKHHISSDDIAWADIIVVMERKHKQRLKEMFLEEIHSTEIHVLDIPDDYQFMDPELIAELEASLDPIINNHFQNTPEP